MTPEERAFPAFALDTLRDLYRAALTDRDLFLLVLTGALLGGRTGTQRGFGKAFALYVTFRRLDAYVDAGIQLARLFRVSTDQQSQSGVST